MRFTLEKFEFGKWQLRKLKNKKGEIEKILILREGLIVFESLNKTEENVSLLLDGMGYVKNNQRITENQMFAHLQDVDKQLTRHKGIASPPPYKPKHKYTGLTDLEIEDRLAPSRVQPQ